MSGPRPITRPRRDSVLDIGGPNSINNFVGSIGRSTSFGQFTDYHPHSLRDDESTAPLLDEEEHHYPVFDDSSSIIDAPQIVAGGSTVYQTMFNAVNVLVGLGILSLPLGFKFAGWIPGFFLLVLGPVCTRYTALLLGRILNKHPQLRSYSDIGQFSLSKSAYSFLVMMFILDLFGASLTLVILFADSFSSVSTVDPTLFKGFICSALFVLSFLPLAALSILSLLGITCVTSIIIILAGAGFLKSTSPGSILSPMPTNMWPQSTLGFLLATGIFMAPWGGHVVFPELHRDMRHPWRYPQAVTATYLFSFSIDAITASLGYLMFGPLVLPEITSNILITKSYPGWLLTCVTVFMGLLPLSKLPLFTLPVISFIQGATSHGFAGKLFARILVAGGLFICSLYITDFGRIQSLLGALICMGTCITAPLIFYYINFQHEMTKALRVTILAGISLSIVISVLGTYAAVVGDA